MDELFKELQAEFERLGYSLTQTDMGYSIAPLDAPDEAAQVTDLVQVADMLFAVDAQAPQEAAPEAKRAWWKGLIDQLLPGSQFGEEQAPAAAPTGAPQGQDGAAAPQTFQDPNSGQWFYNKPNINSLTGEPESYSPVPFTPPQAPAAKTAADMIDEALQEAIKSGDYGNYNKIFDAVNQLDPYQKEQMAKKTMPQLLAEAAQEGYDSPTQDFSEYQAYFALSNQMDEYQQAQLGFQQQEQDRLNRQQAIDLAQSPGDLYTYLSRLRGNQPNVPFELGGRAIEGYAGGLIGMPEQVGQVTQGTAQPIGQTGAQEITGPVTSLSRTAATRAEQARYGDKLNQQAYDVTRPLALGAGRGTAGIIGAGEPGGFAGTQREENYNTRPAISAAGRGTAGIIGAGEPGGFAGTQPEEDYRTYPPTPPAGQTGKLIGAPEETGLLPQATGTVSGGGTGSTNYGLEEVWAPPHFDDATGEMMPGGWTTRARNAPVYSDPGQERARQLLEAPRATPRSGATMLPGGGVAYAPFETSPGALAEQRQMAEAASLRQQAPALPQQSSSGGAAMVQGNPATTRGLSAAFSGGQPGPARLLPTLGAPPFLSQQTMGQLTPVERDIHWAEIKNQGFDPREWEYQNRLQFGGYYKGYKAPRTTARYL